MALILEIRGANGGSTWHRLDALPLTLGRGLSNDVILDDPYVDARHARIALDESGAIGIDDLGSVNGLYTGDARAERRALLHPGAEVRIGRTLLRFRDVDEVLAPALVDDRVHAATNGANGAHAHVAAPVAPPAMVSSVPQVAQRVTLATSLGTWLTRTVPGSLLTIGVTITAFAINAWLGDITRASGGSVFAVVFALVGMSSVWAAGWTLAGRGGERRPSFVSHLAVISLTLLFLLVCDVAKDWIEFLVPRAESAIVLLVAAIYLVVVAAVVATHLSLSSSLSRQLRWRAGLLTSCIIVVLAVMAAIAKDDKFTDVPKFVSTLEPVSARWVPTEDVGAFGGEMRALKKKVDEAAKKEAEP